MLPVQLPTVFPRRRLSRSSNRVHLHSSHRTYNHGPENLNVALKLFTGARVVFLPACVLSQITTGVKGVGRGNTLANRDLLAAFDPRINSMTYVYDNFKWEHCAEDGYDMEDAWHNDETTTAPELRTRFEEGVPRFPMYEQLKKWRAEEKAAENATG